MKLGSCRQCDKCKNVFKIGPFDNISGDGEKAYTNVVLYGDAYDLCPKCTKIVYDLIKRGND